MSALYLFLKSKHGTAINYKQNCSALRCRRISSCNNGNSGNANRSDFPKNHKVIGQHKHADGEYFHYVWLSRKEENGGQLKEEAKSTVSV
jgi:hypothetical protein